MEETRQRIIDSDKLSKTEKDSIITFGYGHIGDGNLHLNITIPGYKDESLQSRLNDFIDPFVMEYVRDAQGSVSAEHGLGLQKAQFLSYSKSPEMIKAMRLIKNAFDPYGIMNPYKVLPPEH